MKSDLLGVENRIFDKNNLICLDPIYRNKIGFLIGFVKFVLYRVLIGFLLGRPIRISRNSYISKSHIENVI